MAREYTLYGFTCGTFAIPAGSSGALYVTPVPGEIFTRLKYGAGGSLEIVGASAGINTTGGGQTGVATAGTGYLFGTTETVEFRGAARYFLVATGATATCFFIKGLSQQA